MSQNAKFQSSRRDAYATMAFSTPSKVVSLDDNSGWFAVTAATLPSSAFPSDEMPMLELMRDMRSRLSITIVFSDPVGSKSCAGPAGTTSISDELVVTATVNCVGVNVTEHWIRLKLAYQWPPMGAEWSSGSPR